MSYNLKCCSFYPNNFDASALEPKEEPKDLMKARKKRKWLSQKNCLH